MKSQYVFIILLFYFPKFSNGQQIVNLTATQQNIGGIPQIEVTWQTIDERNFCYFIIERDTNNSNNFGTQDTLFANGDAPGMTLNYLHTDFGPLYSGVIYSYRLRLDTADINLICHFNRYSDDTASVAFTTSINEKSTIPYSIFPNPTNGNINIKGNTMINSIQIYNSIGEIIYNTTNKNNSEQFNIDISKYPNSFYFISILSDSKNYYHKLIKQ